MHKEILSLAIPSIVTNITVPLLGLVDVAIVGHMGDASYIGAIAVGTMMMNVICWLFGFLRMGTSGMTSQAYGRGDSKEAATILFQAIALGAAIGILFVLFQPLLLRLFLFFMRPSDEIRAFASVYFHVCVFGLPAALVMYGLTGWFIGMQDTRTPMTVSIFQNIVNIMTSLLLVYVFGMKVEGVALGTLTAQYSGLLLALYILRRKYASHYQLLFSQFTLKPGVYSSFSYKHTLNRFFRVNRDIFLRTLFLVAVNAAFTSVGSRQGDVILAVNTLLFQFFTLYSYIMDGFAYAGEAICGKYYGAGNAPSFHGCIRRLFAWGVIMTVVYTAAYYFGANDILHVLSNEQTVIEASEPYLLWVALIPVAGMGAFIWDGVFIGITDSRGMLLSCFVAAIVFAIMLSLFFTTMGNHALWLALLSYLLARGVMQTILFWRSKG
ncbi:MATE family efflux transporter [Prevotella sp. P3-122]|uniref:MATE family efflux transporter n=1 Tax=Prevotella sp. P3-122 TaxID=2024223 RepID=UPI000B97ABE1|nr:MATE family efflux transporter [Prevotella sp. P3-122]OYP63112.1 MATE family efflux transporter [Prevotella sp. P3-122]